MENLIKSTYLVRRDTDKNWEAANPVLKDGEQILVRTADGDKVKIGDGKKNYRDLPFFMEDVLPTGGVDGQALLKTAAGEAWGYPERVEEQRGQKQVAFSVDPALIGGQDFFTIEFVEDEPSDTPASKADVDVIRQNLQEHSDDKNVHVTAQEKTKWDNKLDASQKGVNDGIASLDSTGKVPANQLPEMDYDPAGSAANVQKNLDTHTGSKNNPHGVTAAQVGARPNTWTPTASDVGAAPASHTHPVGQVTGTLPVDKGGTGVSSMSGTDYTTNRPRGMVIQSSVPTSVPNGCIVGVYSV